MPWPAALDISVYPRHSLILPCFENFVLDTVLEPQSRIWPCVDKHVFLSSQPPCSLPGGTILLSRYFLMNSPHSLTQMTNCPLQALICLLGNYPWIGVIFLKSLSVGDFFFNLQLSSFLQPTSFPLWEPALCQSLACLHSLPFLVFPSLYSIFQESGSLYLAISQPLGQLVSKQIKPMTGNGRKLEVGGK